MALSLAGIAVAAIFLIVCCVPSLRAEAGSRPGGRPPFLSATRKEAKKRAPQSAAPSGQPASGCLRGAPWNSLRACGAPFGQPRRVSARSGCVLRHTRHPASTPPQAQPEGGWKPDTGHRCARPRGVQALRAAQAKPSRAQRWPVGMFDPRVPFRMRRGAQRPADQGSRLFERNAVKRVRARPRWTRAPQVARSEAQGRSL